MLVFENRDNRSTRRKPLGAEQRNNKLNPHITPDLEIEPGPHWWKASALTTAPSVHYWLLLRTNAMKFVNDQFSRKQKHGQKTILTRP